MTFASARLKASVWFPPLRGMYQKEALARGATMEFFRTRQMATCALKM